MKKQVRTTKPIEISPKDHYLFSVLCLDKDMTQQEMFKEILEEYRHNGK
jgi:hypothetical protein